MNFFLKVVQKSTAYRLKGQGVMKKHAQLG